MSLCPMIKIKTLLCDTLDVFMLQNHSKEISKALKSLTVFGERVVRLIQHDPSAPAWWIHHDLLIQGCHWLLLCDEVMHTLDLLGFRFNNVESTSTAPAPQHQRWPNHNELDAAARAAAVIYGAPQDSFADALTYISGHA
jgi:hypothetical protein